MQDIGSIRWSWEGARGAVPEDIFQTLRQHSFPAIPPAASCEPFTLEDKPAVSNIIGELCNDRLYLAAAVNTSVFTLLMDTQLSIQEVDELLKEVRVQ